MTHKAVAEADLAEFEAILRGSSRATLLVFRCPDCSGVFSAERIVDEDGERRWGCCPCGLAKAEFSSPYEYVVASPPEIAGMTGAVVWAGPAFLLI